MSRKKDATPEETTRARDLFDDPSSIASVLLKLGRVTRLQLLQAIGQRIQFDELLLGALLKQMGLVGDRDLALALKVQAEMRQGNSLAAELDVLQAKIDESEQGARELSSHLQHVPAHRRRASEKETNVFVFPLYARVAHN